MYADINRKYLVIYAITIETSIRRKRRRKRSNND
jgi:hypothetical protein